MPAGALERAVELLACLGDDPAELSVAELASGAGMPTSTAYRLLAELEQHGLVKRRVDRTIALGIRLVVLGRSAEAELRERLVAPAMPLMASLCEELGETVILTAPCGLEGIVLHVNETDRFRVRLTYTRFARAPMHRGASGKILAAYLEPAERARLIEAAAEPGLEAVLEQIRHDGFVVTSGELDQGASAAAAPILDRRERIVAGISVAGPTDRLAPGLARTTHAVRAAARMIELAYQSP